MTNKILHINSSGRKEGSLTRQVSEKLVDQFKKDETNVSVVQRDLASGLPFIDEQWINANFTDPEQRNDQQKQALAFSDSLVNELQNADKIIIASPIYNFSVPAVLKAWIDLIARARLTFRYTENGPEGLLQNKTAYLVMASGGVPIESEMDLATKYLKQVMRFIGITDVKVIDATKNDLI
ncbi:FMN-dependent NADH-azoreductase [Glaciecola petra]|uniref:FMN dependent NADH:quinone oxidoreductase n=1 Tax=Glaciecola petra TaxID=3075602 RepID=A0ABU2ZRN3_9ALTE|nr:NAD(P)H-dependent oxidoreductase [Aestuariibacter sp. P117]MDT0595292.1 NAD(P)H-dependent oxidoreductase [Aestuariibacter sp. P117]